MVMVSGRVDQEEEEEEEEEEEVRIPNTFLRDRSRSRYDARGPAAEVTPR